MLEELVPDTSAVYVDEKKFPTKASLKPHIPAPPSSGRLPHIQPSTNNGFNPPSPPPSLKQKLIIPVFDIPAAATRAQLASFLYLKEKSSSGSLIVDFYSGPKGQMGVSGSQSPTRDGGVKRFGRWEEQRTLGKISRGGKIYQK